MSSPFQWVSYGGHRHGVPVELVAGQHDQALCGVPVVMPNCHLSESPERCAPTCETCDATWRKRIGYPSRRFGTSNGVRS